MKQARWQVGLGLALWAIAGGALGAQELGRGQLQVAGTRLTVAPESQTVPFDTATVVATSLAGYDAAQGTLPATLRVVADLTGPEIDGSLRLEAVPGEPLHVPRFKLKGEYQLADIRLLDGDRFLTYAQPRSALVRVDQVLVTRITSRALTLDEIRSQGIVIDDDSFKAFNFTFGFGVGAETVDYNVPVIFQPTGEVEVVGGAWSFATGSSARFQPPRLTPFTLRAPRTAPQVGGCTNPQGCEGQSLPPIPGVLLFPTDLGLLNQFFSVVLLATNGAPAGDPLVIRDLTAEIHLPGGLRQARTEPPTPLGVPVPVRVPGPDGELGTADDLTFLVAQATGNAEFLVEGLREGTHIVTIDLDGVLEGLPTGPQRIEGQARGAVLVRDPTFGVTIGHPDVVRAGEQYPLFLTLANTSAAPANLVTVRLPPAGLVGVEVVGQNQQTIDTLLPGDAVTLRFEMRALRTGRVVATSARSTSQVTPAFELTVGVGQSGVPLSPAAIVLPRSTEDLPAALQASALRLVGLGIAAATAPATALPVGSPRPDRARVDERVYELAQAGRQVRYGEDLFDAVATLAAGWLGSADADFDWDRLRRESAAGDAVGAAMAEVFAAEAAATAPRDAVERFAATTAYLPPLGGVLAEGGLELAVLSRTSGATLRGEAGSAGTARTLPYAELYGLGGASFAVLAHPEQGGERAIVRPPAGVAASGSLTLILRDSADRLIEVRFASVNLGVGGAAWVDFAHGDGPFSLFVDADGNGTPEAQLAPSLSLLPPRPFEVVAAVQNAEVDPSGHIVEVLFSHDVDLASLLPVDPDHFSVPGKLSNGGLIASEAEVLATAAGVASNPFAGLRSARLVRVVFDNPLSPYVEQLLTVQGVGAVDGAMVASQVVPIETTVGMPGTLVGGRVIGPDGNPVPFAIVELTESDLCPYCLEDTCREHKTAAVAANAQGEFLFDYVRQTPCGDLFQLAGADPATGQHGTSRGRVRFIGEETRLDIVMVGRGTIHGRVLYDNGLPPTNLRVQAVSAALQEGRLANVDASGNYLVGDLPVGTVSLVARDDLGNFAATTVELAAPGAVVERDLVILKRPPAEMGELRGTVYAADGSSLVANAWVALYRQGELVEVQRSLLDGSFDYGAVPAGLYEIEAFSGDTGRSGAQIFFEVIADRANEITVLLRDDRGAVEGYVSRETLSGASEPVALATVWADGMPAHGRTDATGYYRLEGVLAGTPSIHAYDPVTGVEVSAPVTVVDGETARRDFLIHTSAASGSVSGQVLGVNGLPVVGAVIHRAINDQQWVGETFTDGAGLFTLPDVPPGVHHIHAVAGQLGGIGTAEVRFAGDTPFVNIRFQQGTLRGQTLARNENGELVGVSSLLQVRVTRTRLGLVGLELTPRQIQTAADGTFELSDVLVGPFVITAVNSLYGEVTWNGELTTQGQVLEHQLIFEPNGTVRGQVFNYDGVTPAAGATVTLRHPGLAGLVTTTAADGTFAFDRLVPPLNRPFPLDVDLDEGMVFRRARAYVSLNRRGQEVEVEVVLPEQGAVSGHVEDANGTLVPGALVRLTEATFPNRTLEQEADVDGNFQFHNVFAGTVTLSARALALGGLGGKRTVVLTSEGEELSGVVIRLQSTGEITGLVRSPVDGAAVANADLAMYHDGRLFERSTADGDGAFSFALMPLGSYELRVFDPTSGRAARLPGLTVTTNGQVLNLDVVLEARGTVEGHLYEPASIIPVPGSTVTLRTDSVVDVTLYSSTDPDGLFRYEGVPQGTFTLAARERDGRRRASGAGELVSEGQQVTVDLFLEESGFVTGSVRTPLGVPDAVFGEPVNVTARQDGLVVGSSLEPSYHFGGLIAGRSFTVEAAEQGGLHRGRASGQLASEGQDLALDVRMQPLGSVEVSVVDGAGNPVTGADVRLTTRGFYGGSFAGSTGAGSSLTFANVGAGDLTAFATDPSSLLSGSTTGQLTSEGQLVSLVVALQPSGSIEGTVLLSDGTTPAAGALVVASINSHTYTVTSDAAGFFRFPSLPLGTVRLDVQEFEGPGTRLLFRSLGSQGEVIDVGTVVLDDADPRVLAITPADGTIGVGPSAQLVIHFSEPIKTSAYQSSYVTLRKVGGDFISVTQAFSDGDTTLTLTPVAPLASFTSFQIKVTTGIQDVAGRNLAAQVVAGFTTIDWVPPAVIAALPADGALGVPLDSTLVLTFSEPVVETSLSGPGLALTDLVSGQGVSTTFQLDTARRVVTVVPVGGLAGERSYRLTATGATDAAGNPMVPFSATFRTVDTVGPAVVLTAPAGPLDEGVAYPLTAVSAGADDLAAVSFYAGERLLGTDTTAPFEQSYTPNADDAAAGTVALSAVGRDTTGNLGPAAVETRPITADPPPEITLTVTPESVLFPGQQLHIDTVTTDATGISHFQLTLSGALTANVSTNYAGPTSLHDTRAYTLTAQPAVASVDIEVRVTDLLGKVAVATRHLAAGDFEAPVVTLTAPAEGAQLTAGDPVLLTATASDNQAVSGVTFHFGAASFTDTTAPYEWAATVPGVPSAQDVEILVEATDPQGNRGSFTRSVHVEPFVDPGRPQITVLCPSDGAPLVPGIGLTATFQATDDEAVERVEVFVDGAANATAVLTTPPYSLAIQAPAGAALGQVVPVRAVVYDFGGNSAETSFDLEVMDGTRLAGATTIAATSTSFENQTLIVTATTTVDGHHSFQDLIVLGSGQVTQQASTTAVTKSLDVAVTGRVYVGCQAKIDVSGRGYLASRTYPNVSENGRSNAGGSHGGRGVGNSTPTYDSVTDPADPGSGGNSTISGSGHAGGGVVRITAGERLTVDGQVLANGATGTNGSGGTGGAGGTISLAAPALDGQGALKANGGESAGGGRIALLGETVGGTLVAKAATYGRGAGTIFVRRAGDTYGELIADGGGQTVDQFTELPAVGRGVIDAVGPDSLTDASASFRHTLVGVEVALNDALATTWPITAHAHLGQSLSLDTTAEPFLGQVGDVYQGVRRFDRVTVKGGARLAMADRLLTTEPPSVEVGSFLLDGDPAAGPAFLVTTTPATGVVAGQSLDIRLQALSLAGIDRLDLSLAGALVSGQSFDYTGQQSVLRTVTVSLPDTAAGQSLEITATALDLQGRPTTVVLSVPVAADTTAPTATVVSPTEGTVVTAGDTVSVRVDAADNVRFTTTVELGGDVRTSNLPSFTTSLRVPPVAVRTLVPIHVSVVDPAGNQTDLIRNLDVVPAADAQAPVVTASCPSPGALVVPGGSLRFEAQVSDETAVWRLAWFAGTDPTPLAVTFPGTAAQTPSLVWTVPAGLGLDEATSVRLVATDFGGNATELAWPLVAKPGTQLAASQTLAAGDGSLDGQTVIVPAGVTLTLDGAHTFRDLVVLPGGTVTQLATTNTAVHRLELAISHDAYLGCSVPGFNAGALHADGKGYPGAAASGQLAMTYPLSTSGGAGNNQGGSHGGQGGDPLSSGPVIYDSVVAPAEPGGGGGARSTAGTTGGAGGGAVLLSLGGSLVVDGRLAADGVLTNAGGGAGGTLRVEAAALSGFGTLSARGAGGSSAIAGGGGGRIALQVGSLDEALLGRTSAAGGQGSSIARSAAPGTLFVRRASDGQGQLIFDNAGVTHGPLAGLPGLGSGVIDAVTIDSITDLEASFASSVVGAWVEVGGDPAARWQVVSHAHHGDTLGLDVASLPLSAQPGDPYRGLWRFNRLLVRGAATASASDGVELDGLPEVEVGSTWLAPNAGPPQLDTGRISYQMGVFGVSLVGSAGAVVDADPPVILSLANQTTGAEETTEVASDGSFSLPFAAASSDLVTLTATDNGQPVLSSAPFTVVPPAGDEALAAVLPEFPPSGVSALADSLLAHCGDCYRDSEVFGSFEVSLYDLADPHRPSLVSRFSLDSSTSPCNAPADACFFSCDGSGGEQACYDACDAAYSACLGGQPCPGFCSACTDSCTAAGAGASCFDACGECANACPATVIEVDQPLVSVNTVATEGGVVALADPRAVRVIDARDPVAPVLRDANQWLELLPAGSTTQLADIEIADGYLYAVAQGSPHTLFVVDVHDPRQPWLVASTPLTVRDVVDIEVRDGLLHVLSNGTGSDADYKVFAVGDPASPLLRNAASNGGSGRRGQRLGLFGNLAAWSLESSTSVAGFHLFQPGAQAPALSSLPFVGGLVAAVGERELVTDAIPPAVAVGSFDRDTGSYQVEELVDAPIGNALAELVSAGGLLWLQPSFGIPRGYPSRLLEPWLDGAAVTASGSLCGTSLSGGAGAAGDAAEVEATVAGSTYLATPNPDGSFSLSLGAQEVGEPIRVRARDGEGFGGNALELRAAPALRRTAVAGGLRRLAADAELAAGVVAHPASGGAVAVLDLSGATASLASTIELAAAASDAVVAAGALYVAADVLRVFDLNDPAAPVEMASLDLFAGTPPAALAVSGDRLYAFGGSGAAAAIVSLDLTLPLAPAVVSGGSVATGSVAFPRLVITGPDLWLAGDGLLRRYALGGTAPVLGAAGSFSGKRVVDVESLGSEVWAAVRGEGPRQLAESAGALSLGAAPSPLRPVFGLFSLPGLNGPGLNGDRLWWAEGLGGARTVLRVEEPVAGRLVPVDGKLGDGCLAYDGVVLSATGGSRLLLATDCGVEELFVTTSCPASVVVEGRP